MLCVCASRVMGRNHPVSGGPPAPVPTAPWEAMGVIPHPVPLRITADKVSTTYIVLYAPQSSYFWRNGECYFIIKPELIKFCYPHIKLSKSSENHLSHLKSVLLSSWVNPELTAVIHYYIIYVWALLKLEHIFSSGADFIGCLRIPYCQQEVHNELTLSHRGEIITMAVRPKKILNQNLSK